VYCYTRIAGSVSYWSS